MPDIRIWREKNKPKIRICQSGTDMQTLLVGQGPTSLPNGRMDCVRRIVCVTGPTSASANGSVVVTIDNHPAVVPFAYKVRAKWTNINQRCPWVGLTHGSGWVEIFQFLVGWVGSTIAKMLKFWKDCVSAFTERSASVKNMNKLMLGWLKVQDKFCV